MELKVVERSSFI